MPHPSEAKINIRIQTIAGASADDAFRTGLQQLVDTAEHIAEVYDLALETFDNLNAVVPTNATYVAQDKKQGRRKSFD